MKIKVFNREEFEHYKTDKLHIAISIIDPNSKSVKLINKDSLFDIIELQFYDLDKDTELSSYKDLMFTESHAKRILNFITRNQDKVDTILVHCEAGISRSAGVAGALSLIYNNTDEEFFNRYLPNRLVYRTILEVYYNELGV